ncbi:hypothetical protein BGZ76_006058, partial [Entomortierella beljakovae]
MQTAPWAVLEASGSRTQGTRQLSHMGHNFGKELGKLSIEVAKLKDYLDVMNTSRVWPIYDDLDLGRIHLDTIRRDDIAQKFHPEVLREDKDVIKEYHHEVVKVLDQDVLKECLERCWCT